MQSPGTTPIAWFLWRDDTQKKVRVDLRSEKLRAVTNDPILVFGGDTLTLWAHELATQGLQDSNLPYFSSLRCHGIVKLLRGLREPRRDVCRSKRGRSSRFRLLQIPYAPVLMPLPQMTWSPSNLHGSTTDTSGGDKGSPCCELPPS